MPAPITDATLRHVALLYLAVAHGADDYLSDAELNAVVTQLEQRFGSSESTRPIQEVVMEILAVYVDAPDPLALVAEAISALRKDLPADDLAALVHDLTRVAHADGVVFHDERGLLDALAESWNVLAADAAGPPSPLPQRRFGDDVMHDLAFIYLVLGHGTDYELSESERRMMLRRLEEWQPQLSESQIQAILDDAMNRYAQGPSDRALDEAIRSVKLHLPPEQRKAALADLIKIANADGVFLDDEEDLINRLLTEWEVEAYANYGEHGRKR